MRLRTLASGLAAASLAASSAGALEDLTGSWLGTATCDIVLPAQHDKVKSDVTVVIDDDPTGNAFLTFNAVTYHVAVIEDPDSPAKGRVGGQECNASAILGVDVLALSVKAKDGSDKGTMSGELVTTRTGKAPTVSVCKVKLKRVSTTIETPITDCPL
jgi:hypothetical protein